MHLLAFVLRCAADNPAAIGSQRAATELLNRLGIEGRDGWFFHTEEADLADARDRFAALSPQGMDAKEGGISKEWCLKMAQLEAGQEIGAGMPDHPLRQPETDAAAPSQGLDAATVERCAQVADQASSANLMRSDELRKSSDPIDVEYSVAYHRKHGEAKAIAAAIRALATDPHQHGGKGA